MIENSIELSYALVENCRLSTRQVWLYQVIRGNSKYIIQLMMAQRCRGLSEDVASMLKCLGKHFPEEALHSFMLARMPENAKIMCRILSADVNLNFTVTYRRSSWTAQSCCIVSELPQIPHTVPANFHLQM